MGANPIEEKDRRVSGLPFVGEYLRAMSSAIRGWVGFGVSAGLTHAEQRRIRTINVVSVFAFFATAVFAALFFPSRPDRVPIPGYLGLAVVYLAGYAMALGLNRRERHDAAVAVLLATGLVNIVGATVTVGFGGGPAVFLVTVATGAVLLTRRDATLTRWLFVVGSVAAYAMLVLIDPSASEALEGSLTQSILVAASYGGMVAFVITIIWYQRRYADTTEDALAEANELSERLLLNILPAEIADRLKADEYPIADRKGDVTILFADIVGSTTVAERLSASDLVTTLDGLFTAFDEIADRHGLEKIKTVGDGYFAVAGLVSADGDHTRAAADAALAMRDELTNHHFPGIGRVHMRFGLHTGPVVAGVIGKRKFSFDVWGDAVNTASRMESASESDMIQVSQEVHDRLVDDYDMRPRGAIAIRGKGELPTYELVARRPAPSPIGRSEQ